MAPSPPESVELRRQVAEAIELLVEQSITYEDFLQRVPEDSDDDEIAEALDLVEHIPRRNRPLGVSEAEYRASMQRIADAVGRLRSRPA